MKFEYEVLPDNDEMLRANDPLWEDASSAMASNMVDDLIIYKPLIDYFRSHVHFCVVL